ncbi:MAG TPA: pyridoxamine 5'-phosphate oxidase family protein [Pilimelia sp.]|nr:pyridoxamine 5'-phosphate oxidase family protein [Pilimelia sp.]
MKELDAAEALRLLASVSVGRVVFTEAALPAIRPVNHLVDDGEIIIRSRLTTRIGQTIGTQPETVVAYQADDLDPVSRTGWSVVATGLARLVTDPARIERYEALLHPWVNTVMDTVISIQPEIITGFRLVPDDPAAG